MTDEQEVLPTGWTWATIADLCEINPKHASDQAETLPVSFVPMAAVDEQTGAITAAVDRPYSEVRKGYTHFAEGDVLFAKITPCMENGKAAVARGLTNGIGCGTTEFFVLRSRGAVLPEYIHRFVRQDSYRRQARQTMQSGVGQARVPKEFIEDTRIPLPPLAEQRRIVGKLDELLASSRAARAALDAVPALLERYRQAVLAAGFRGDLTASWREHHPTVVGGEELVDALLADLAGVSRSRRAREKSGVDDGDLPPLPESWRWIAADACTRRLTVGHVGPMQSRYVASGIPFLRSQNVRENRIDPAGLQYIPANFHTELAKSALVPGDVVIVRSGAPGVAAVVPTDLPVANCADLVITRFSDLILPDLVVRFLNSEQCRRRVFDRQVGVAQQHFNVGAMRTLPIPLMPVEEQRELLRLLHQHEAVTAAVRERVEYAREHLKVMNAASLHRAFRGELVPQYPTDEPAVVVLARLRAERASVPTPRARRATVRA